MPKKKSSNNSKQDTPRYLIDTKIPFPEESKHLIEGGELNIYFDVNTREMILDISSELMRSRRIPVDTEEVGVSDAMVIWLAHTRKDEFGEDGEDAILAAKHIYETQTKDCNRDAIVLAMTAYTEIVGQYDKEGNTVPPVPYEDGQELFVPTKRSSFVDMMKNRRTDIPQVHRNLKNPYEARIKWLDDVLNEGGYEFYSAAVTAINTAVMDIIRGLPESDDDGFPPGGVGEPVVVSSDAVSEDKEG